LHAPHLLDVEVAQALRRYALAGDVTPRIWELRRSISAYDAAYVALAEGLGAPLLTRDARLARSHGHRARTELV
jgi:predicted nucleic acid-binding protein